MILKMEKLSAIGLLSDKDAVIRALMRYQCVQVKSPETMENFEEIRAITQNCPADVYALEQKQSRFAAAISSISPYTSKGGMFAKRPRVAYDDLENSDTMDRADALCGEIERIVAKISDLRGAKGKNQFQIASLVPWAGDGLPLETGGTKATTITRYLLPAKINNEEMLECCAKLAPDSYIHPVSADKEQQYAMVVCYIGQEESLREALKEYGAAKVSFPGLTGTAQENIAAASARIAQTDAEIASLESSLRKLGEDLYPIKYAYDAVGVEIQRTRINDDILNTRDAFCFTAWVPESAKEEAVKILEQHGFYYQFQECGEDEEAPILLKNSKLVTPYESITQMYSLPSYHGIDPDNFIAPFFFLFFGMMLSDAGYGLVLIFGGLFLLKKMDMEPGGGKLIKVLVMGGISTVIWGALYGSWFGDIFQVIAHNFFGKTIRIPMLLDPLSDPMTIMVMSFAFGIVHLFVGMGLKAYLLVKRGHPWEALFDVGFWYMVIAGLVMLLVGSVAGVGVLSRIGQWMAIIGAVGLILTQGRSSKNPIMKLVNGIMSLYDITGYFSDVLSYSRILALGLATGVIATVVNTMGSLMGGGVLSAIVLLVVFIFGHMLNMAINALGAYVHTSRLQYVEFFGKFYEAGGKAFAPLRASTKYIMVFDKEDT